MRTKLLTTIALLLMGSQVIAATISLDFSTLPSAQGWQYVGSAPESTVFAVSGGVLVQNSLGLGNGLAYYGLTGVDTASPFSLAVRGRLLEEENGIPLNGFGFLFGVNFPSQQFSVGLGTNRIVAEQAGGPIVVTTSLDTSQFHDYLLTGSPLDGKWQLFVDDQPVPVGSGLSRPGAFPTGTIDFGDGTMIANARGEWARLVFTQVPEPSAVGLLLCGALALLGRLILSGERRAA